MGSTHDETPVRYRAEPEPYQRSQRNESCRDLLSDLRLGNDDVLSMNYAVNL